MNIINIPNILTLIRGASAFLFLYNDPIIRGLAILIAGATDWLDGFLARRWHQTSRIGTFLDPLMDKFFVLFILGIFLIERRLTLGETLLFLTRDYALVAFTLYLAWKGAWSKYQINSFWMGKVATTLQYLALLVLSLGIAIPKIFLVGFLILGPLSLLELLFRLQMKQKNPNNLNITG